MADRALHRRLWRVRRLHRHIDAELTEARGHGVELRLTDGERVIYTRRWPDRAGARADAEARLADLVRAGWTAHW